jgi:hypothetical protein
VEPKTVEAVDTALKAPHTFTKVEHAQHFSFLTVCPPKIAEQEPVQLFAPFSSAYPIGRTIFWSLTKPAPLPHLAGFDRCPQRSVMSESKV